MIELADRPCPVCGTAAHSRLFAEANIDETRIDARSFSSRKTPEFMHYRYLECATCDLVYASPAPTAATTSSLYRDAEYASAAEAGHAADTYARLLARLLPRLPDRVAALDVGAGDGAFLERLAGAGFDRVVGIEPSRAPLAQAAPAVRELIVEGTFVPGVVEGPFTLVTCFQTLEHIPDPLETLRLAADLLAPGGALVLVVHDRRGLPTRLLGGRSPILDLEHLQLFSRNSLGAALQGAGLALDSVAPFANTYPLAYWLSLAPLPGPLRAFTRSLPRAVASAPVRLRAGNLAAVAFKP
ncbi:MAG: class I SAM-dependent methyltransferase [Gaiellaceae bacterium]